MKGRIDDYDILVAELHEDLVEDMYEKIEQGWTPLGPAKCSKVLVSDEDEEVIRWFQTIVKRKSHTMTDTGPW